MRRFTAFTGSRPCDWTAGDIEDFTSSLMTGSGRLASSTIRGYHLTLRLFCDYLLRAWPGMGRSAAHHSLTGPAAASPAADFDPWRASDHPSREAPTDASGEPKKRTTNAVQPTAPLAGLPEDAFDCAAGHYLGDPATLGHGARSTRIRLASSGRTITVAPFSFVQPTGTKNHLPLVWIRGRNPLYRK